MMTLKQWQAGTSAIGHKRGDLLKAVDEALAAYGAVPSSHHLNGLCTAVENWAASKKSATEPSGYAALQKGLRDRTSAVQTLVTDIRQLAGKPAYWPDAGAGTNYIVKLDDPTRRLLQDMRTEAASRSVMMIAAMDVDWMAFGFDQLGAASSTAINLGHTNYGSGWKGGAENNQTSLGQTEYTAAGKIFAICFDKAGEVLEADDRVKNVLRGAGLAVNIVLGVLKFHVFKDGVMSKAVPILGPLKESVDAVIKGGVQLRLVSKSFQRVSAAQALVVPTSDAATAINAFENLLIIETSTTITNLAYRLLKDTAMILTEVLTYGAMTVVQVVTAVVELIVGFVYQLVYSLVFRKSVKQCREWVKAGAAPEDLDFRAWIASCPLLGAYFLLGLSAGGGATTALSMFSQPGEISSTDFQAASVKLLRVRQAAAAFVQDSPVKVKWTGPNGEKFKWIDGLVASDALSASVGINSMKIHHWSLSEDADKWTKFKHKFHEHGNDAWSLGKIAWSVV